MSLRRPLSILFPLFGLILLCLVLFQSVTLSLGSLPARVGVGVTFLLLAVLSLFLLAREGVGRDRLLMLLLPVALALFLRGILLDHATLDYQDFLSKWVEYFRQNGGFPALKDPVGNYNVPYLYMLAALSYFPVPDLYGIKLFSIFFDILLAWGGARLVRRLTDKESAPSICFCVLLFLPTVILNGACWGQCDSVWAALCMLSLADALEHRPVRSVALLALAFSFKLQAIFVIPLWCALWFTGRVKFRHFFVFPAVFMLTALPALLAGKPMADILRVYLDQAGSSVAWQTVNYNSPSVFSLLPYHFPVSPWVPKAAICAAFGFMLILLLLLFVRRGKADERALVLTGAALSLGIPFFLPYMHERYFFLGGVLLAVLSCAQPTHTPAAIGAELASLGGYHAYLRKRYFLVLTFFGVTWAQLLEGLCMLFAVTWLTLSIIRSLWAPEKAADPTKEGACHDDP